MKPDFNHSLKSGFREYLLKRPDYQRFEHILANIDHILFLDGGVEYDREIELQPVGDQLSWVFPNARYVIAIGTRFHHMPLHVIHRKYFEIALRIPERFDGTFLDWEVQTMTEALDEYVGASRR